MLAEEERGGDEETVASSVRASRGQWSIVGEIDVSGLDGRLFYGAFALRSGDPGGGFCVAGVSHRRSPVAFGYSRFARVQGLAVTRTEQGRVKVRYTQGGHPGDRWRVIVEAADGDSAVGVLLTETVGPRGRFRRRSASAAWTTRGSWSTPAIPKATMPFWAWTYRTGRRPPGFLPTDR